MFTHSSETFRHVVSSPLAYAVALNLSPNLTHYISPNPTVLFSLAKCITRLYNIADLIQSYTLSRLVLDTVWPVFARRLAVHALSNPVPHIVSPSGLTHCPSLSHCLAQPLQNDPLFARCLTQYCQMTHCLHALTQHLRNDPLFTCCLTQLLQNDPLFARCLTQYCQMTHYLQALTQLL